MKSVCQFGRRWFECQAARASGASLAPPQSCGTGYTRITTSQLTHTLLIKSNVSKYDDISKEISPVPQQLLSD